MLGIFNSVFRTSTRTETWNPPEYWQNPVHLSAADRQDREAARQREKIEQDTLTKW